MLLAIDLYKDLIDEEDVTVASVLPLQSSGVESSELDTPESDGLAADSDASFGQQIFDIAVTQVEAIVEPDGSVAYFEKNTRSVVFRRSYPVSANA